MNCDQSGIITADDLKALKLADSVVFEYRNGGAIRAILERAPKGDPFTDGDRRAERTIVVGSNLTGGTAFAMIQAAKFSETWRSILYVLKVGDRVSLEWAADYFTTDYLRHALGDGKRPRAGDWPIEYSGLHADALRLRIFRPARVNGRDNFRRLVFTVDVSVCPENSARMVRPATYSLTA